ncbi:hypothetical protein GGS20DRAFT_496935 [Poronia punctata]|nr:hypothetical protein GGS20DRAFT_496935 [Poronia punctata]
MMRSDYDLLSFTKPYDDGSYSSSLASSASSSSSASGSGSVWSDLGSHISDNTRLSSYGSSYSDTDQPESQFFCQPSDIRQAVSESSLSWQRVYQQELHDTLQTAQAAPAEHTPHIPRQNPRRTNNSAVTRNGPPSLTRQSDRKVNFVDNLVDSSTQIVEAIWPLASVFHRQEMGHKAVLPLRTFIQETLRRSRTSYSTLQVALYYLILIKPHVPSHDFTMEQPEDVHATRALQCGRRMFLAALILASKYLQDRNYSARAWSKISGLATQEINQNEMVFLSAVNWKLHITDLVFKRWTEVVLKYRPSQPPASGSACLGAFEKQNQDWKNLILQLDPDLDNVEVVIPISSSPTLSAIPGPPTLRPPSTQRSLSSLSVESADTTPTPANFVTPTVMEPSPASVSTRGRLAPALGLLPTPRLTPQSTGFCTPAVTATAPLLGDKGSMSFAMAQAAQLSASHSLDRWPGAINTSPRSYMLTRRPSVTNSVSSASSPESMVSDSSRTSRSSSISSASSLAGAPSVKLDVRARCRNAMLYGERYSMKPAIASVPEDYEQTCVTSSPESFTGTVGKELYNMTLETPLARRDCDLEDAADAARALQELQNNRGLDSQMHPSRRRPRTLKRSRRVSVDNTLQENVRAILSSPYCHEKEWQDGTEGARTADADDRQTPVYTSPEGCRKRLCCHTDAMNYVIPAIHPAAGGPGRPGMWEGILN